MCFSSTASFTASSVLVVLGGLTVQKTAKKGELLFASIPLLFAVQQLIEGLIWLSFDGKYVELRHLFSQLYVVFVGVLWPVVTPLSLRMIEGVDWRKNTMLLVAALGVVIAAFTVNELWQFPVTARIDGYCISYDHPVNQPNFMLAVYVLATCAAFFISSSSIIKLLGCVNLLAFFVTYHLYSYDLASVWCFFAAIISGLIYLYFDKQALVSTHILKPFAKNQ